jgi:preflagellin peptidase FlaK
MTLIEGSLIVLLAGIAIIASLSDLYKGRISNWLLLFGLAVGCILNAIYYWIFADNLIWNYLINLSLVTVMSVLFYGFHVWSAGDSKFSILLVFLFPARLYNLDQKILAPAIAIFIFIFSIGFLYVVVESVVLGLKRRDLFHFGGFHIKLKRFFKRYFVIASVLFICSQSIFFLFPAFYEDNHLLILFFNLFIILLLQDQKWPEHTAVVVGLTGACVILLLLLRTQIAINWWLYLIVGLVILTRMFSEKYNYEVIATSTVRPGMILSFNTVVRFQPSRVQGLPLHTTEDLRSRLSEEDVQAILRWEKSKFGEGSIVIVRKLPFAIIISAGMVLFILTEVFFL